MSSRGKNEADAGGGETIQESPTAARQRDLYTGVKLLSGSGSRRRIQISGAAPVVQGILTREAAGDCEGSEEVVVIWPLNWLPPFLSPPNLHQWVRISISRAQPR